MEYAIGNITVAISWSDYFTGLLSGMGIHIPYWMQMDYLSASRGFEEASAIVQSGKSINDLPNYLQEAYYAWSSAPQFFSFRLVADLPALFIIILITALVYRGMKESKNASNLMVIVKLAIILLVIAVGIFYVDTENWNPFAPNGISGILKGVSAVFFAYIGFDAISTTAEECKDPQRDLPRGMMWAIIICTFLYIIIALVLTGMVNYSELNVGDPLAFVFEKLDLKWMSGIIAVSAVIAMASVLLVFQMGQPRIWMSMSRDGLLPKKFAKIHPKFKTPSFSTIVVGFVVAVPALFMNLTMVTDLCSIGTLFAFVVVCAGVLVLQNQTDIPRGKFKTPYINSKYIVPFIVIGVITYFFMFNYEKTINFLNNEKELITTSELLIELNDKEVQKMKMDLLTPQKENNLEDYLNNLTHDNFISVAKKYNIQESTLYKSGFSLFAEKIPFYIFILICIFLTIQSIRNNLSLIPLLGLVCCLYMMSELGISNWVGFGIWLIVGLVLYFSYGKKHSKLNIPKA
jgi:amino acid transporter